MAGLVALVLVGSIGTFLVAELARREYWREFARTNSDLPGWLWWLDSDRDPHVERLRRRYRNLTALGSGLAILLLALLWSLPSRS